MRGLVWGATLAVGLLMAAPARAESGYADPLWKLHRGLANLAFGFPGEFIHHSWEGATATDERTLAGTLASAASGMVMGFGWGVARVGSGLVDFLTFPVPFNDNRPLLEPEFPM